MKSKQLISICLSFIILFAISCKNDDKTGSDGGDLVSSVPDANTSGGQASGLADAFYTGTLTRTDLKVDPTSQATMASAVFPESYPSGEVSIYSDTFTGGGPMSMLVSAPIYQSGTDYEASFENSAQGAKTYIKFKISGDTLEVTQYITGATTEGVSMQATYTGTLTKQTVVS